ncbi:hypothetical protein LZC95_45335 [Pendulispora brunnea]|uniref:Uncharacterized protein n=1 Tax=Pendulispora brunnea TaxID=2905690 RepID=A0ABZ2K978_9BACT
MSRICRVACFVLIVATLAILGFGCDGDAQSAPPGVGPALDFGQIARQVHFAFRPADGAWVGGDTAYGVRVTDDALRMTPFQGTQAGESLTVRTLSVQRESISLSSSAGAPRIESDGALTIPRGTVVERLRNDEKGTEQSWHFERRPSGKGNLLVRIRIDGQRYTGESAAGHHFEDPKTGLGFCYGPARWMEANGQSHSVQATWDRGDVILTVPAALVEASEYPAQLDPTISPEFGMDQPISVARGGGQGWPQVAFNGTNYLVAWLDVADASREGSLTYAARVAPSGALLDPHGILVSSATRGTPPAVVSDGAGWLVLVPGDASIGPTSKPTGVRISAEGKLAGRVELPLGQGPLAGTFVRDHYLAVGAGKASGTSGVRIRPDGTLLDPSGFAITNQVGSVAVASNGSLSLMVLGNRSGTRTPPNAVAARITPEGTVLDLDPFPIDTTSIHTAGASVSSDGHDFLVIYETMIRPDPDANYDDAIVAKRITSDGVIRDAAPIVLATDGSYELRSPTVTFTGQSYVAAWERNRPYYHNGEIRLGRVGLQGEVLHPPRGVLVADTTTDDGPQMAFDGSNVLLVWSRPIQVGRSWHETVHSGRFSTVLRPVDGTGVPLPIQSANGQSRPAVAAMGSQYLVVWEDGRGGVEFAISGARVDATGKVLDPSGIAVARGVGRKMHPTVASNGTGYMVAWRDEREENRPQIYGARVDAAGGAKEPGGFALGTMTSYDRPSPAIASDGTGYLVAWVDDQWHLRGATAPADTGSRPAFELAGTNAQVLDIAYNGAQYLLVWDEGDWNRVNAVRIGKDGALADSVLPIAEWAKDASVASGGSNWMVTWRSYGDDGSGLRGARISGVGTLLDRPGFWMVKEAPSEEISGSDIAWYGDSYFAVWTKGPYRKGDVFGARINPKGARVDAADVTISAHAEDDRDPVLAGAGKGQVLIAYSRFDPAPPIAATRVYARLASDTASGTACSGAGGCASGFCVDGFCCNTACNGTCQACSATKTGMANGTCAPVLRGTDPDAECAADALACTIAVCGEGACVQEIRRDTCLVNGVCHAPGDTAGDGCIGCAPAVSQTQFTAKPDGTACISDDQWCTSDQCRAGACEHTLSGLNCIIGAACYARDQVNPADRCEECNPYRSRTEWSKIPYCGLPDAGTGDGGVADGGSADGGVRDGGDSGSPSTYDSGSGEWPPPPDYDAGPWDAEAGDIGHGGGCGCHVQEQQSVRGQAVAGMFVIAALMVRRRRATGALWQRRKACSASGRS